MQVTEVRIFLVNENMLKAYATLTLDACFVIRDVKVIRGPAGYIVSMPSRKQKDGIRRDIAHPINAETRKMIEEAVMAEYLKVAGESGSTPTDTSRKLT
jgi:stage V sporulation protein G